MNRRDKIIFSLTLVVFLFIATGVLAYNSIVSWSWNKAATAAGSMPYQVGLTNTVIIPCFTTGEPPTCEGGALCSTVDAGSCLLYSDVNGMSAGGTGQPPLLLSKIAMGVAGLTPGGQLIYGGTTNSMYLSAGNSVLASVGGCWGSGCAVRPGAINKFLAWLYKLDKYIIAGFKNN